MKQRKLRSYVLPTLYVIVLILVFGAVSLISSLMNSNPDYLYTIGIIKDQENTIPVANTNYGMLAGIVKPYLGEEVKESVSFYDVNSDEVSQQKALIFYQNTYMKNTGVLYTSDEEFDLIMSLDGTIKTIREDNILGKVVEVDHNPNLKTIYYGVGDISVKENDMLSQGDVIGRSSKSKISDAKNALLFEVYYNGVVINPEDYYQMDPSTLN